MRNLFLCFPLVCLLACHELTGSPSTDGERTATAWAESYFRFHIKEAVRWTTPESVRWLRFTASNLTERDLSALSSCDNDIEVSIDESSDVVSDTLQTVTLRIDHALVADTIGRPAHLVDDYRMTVVVVRRPDGWKVRMEGLPQNEKRNRD